VKVLLLILISRGKISLFLISSLQLSSSTPIPFRNYQLCL
jgi:hypothetical protein